MRTRPLLCLGVSALVAQIAALVMPSAACFLLAAFCVMLFFVLLVWKRAFPLCITATVAMVFFCHGWTKFYVVEPLQSLSLDYEKTTFLIEEVSAGYSPETQHATGQIIQHPKEWLKGYRAQILVPAGMVPGEIIEGEDTITKARKKYKRFFYKENPHVLPEVFKQVANADLIILSMGSLYTSVLPHLLCSDVVKAINQSKAKKMYICNAMTQPGETDDFGVSDHVNFLESYLGKDTIDSVIVSTTEIPEELLKKYETEEQKNLVKVDYENMKNSKYEVIESDLLTTVDGTIKHNSLKLSSIIFFYLMNKNEDEQKKIQF